MREDMLETRYNHKGEDFVRMGRPTLTNKRKIQLRILLCLDYVVNHIRACDDYDFRHAWNTTSGISVPCSGLLACIDNDKLNGLTGPIPDDETFEDTVRVAIQSMAHAFYLKDWESIGPYLHPRKKVLDTGSDGVSK